VPGVSPDDDAPEADLRRVADANERFLRAIGPLSDGGVRQPIALEGWTRGHVLTHLARNADSHCRRAAAAVRGEVVEQYAGGFEGRAAEIEAGAGRSAEVLITEFGTSSSALAAAWGDLPPEAWSMTTRDVGGRERPLRALPARRWQELEVHLVDLEVGVSYGEWSDDFVEVFLPKLRATITDRLPTGAALPLPAVADQREELAWLYGRLHRPDLPELSPWG
jgi:maleylpyruvate isomerase